MFIDPYIYIYSCNSQVEYFKDHLRYCAITFNLKILENVNIALIVFFLFEDALILNI